MRFLFSLSYPACHLVIAWQISIGIKLEVQQITQGHADVVNSSGKCIIIGNTMDSGYKVSVGYVDEQSTSMDFLVNFMETRFSFVIETEILGYRDYPQKTADQFILYFPIMLLFPDSGKIPLYKVTTILSYTIIAFYHSYLKCATR